MALDITVTVNGPGTAPTITGTPLLTDDQITVDGTLPITFYYVTTSSATPPSAATIKATPDGTMVIAGGANFLVDMNLETAYGTWYLHYLASNTAGDSAIVTEEYILAAPPIQFVGGKTWTTAGTTGTTSVSLTDLTGGLAAAPAAGDFVVVAYNFAQISDTDANVAVTSGYTEVADLWSNAFIETNLGLFYKFMPGSPDTNVTMGATGDGAYGGAAAISVWRGVNVTTPLDGVTPTTATGTGDSNPNPPPITPASADAVVLVAGGGAQNTSGGSPYTASDLIHFLTAYSESTADASVGLGAFRWESGEFNPASWTGATDTQTWAAACISLKPA